MSEQCKYCKVRGLKEFISKKNGKPYFRWIGDGEIHTYDECRSIQSKSTTWVEVIKKHNSEAAAGLTKNNGSTSQQGQGQQTVQITEPIKRNNSVEKEPAQDMGILLNTIYDIVRNIDKRLKENEQFMDGIGQKMELLIEKVGYPAPELIVTESEQKVIDDVKPKENEKENNKKIVEVDGKKYIVQKTVTEETVAEWAKEDKEQKEMEKQDKVKVDIHKLLLEAVNSFGTANKQKLYSVNEGPYSTKEDIDGALDWLLFNNKIGIIEDEENGETIYTKINEPIKEPQRGIDFSKLIKEKEKEKEEHIVQLNPKINYQDIDVNTWNLETFEEAPIKCAECHNPKIKGFVNREIHRILCEGCFLKHYTHDDFKKITGIDEKPISQHETEIDPVVRARTLEQINEIDNEYSF